MVVFRFPSSVCRLLALLALLLAGGSASAAWAQEAVSPLPPPTTRGIYRSRWFEFLTAHIEDDERAAAAALSDLKRASRALGIHGLSDFSRTAVFEGRQAEEHGRFDRAARAYDAALELDEENCDAHFSRMNLLLRQGSYGNAAAAFPRAARSLVATRESRLAVLSALALWFSAGLTAATLGTILILLIRHQRLSAHALDEMAQRFLGKGAALPLALILLGLPLAFGLGPLWLLLYWGALVLCSSDRDERVVLTAALLVLGFLAPLLAAVSHENILERSPLFVAAADLEERREDASAEDGLRQAAAVFGDDPDVWFLLGIYAERSSDRDRALDAYDRAVRADPGGYEALLNRGNIQFLEGNFALAVRDYETAAERAPRSAEVFYNLALARAETYDFVGQEDALRRARSISGRDVAFWSGHPTLARVVSASYPISRARKRIETWNRDPRGGRLPGHAPPHQVVQAVTSPFAIGPWVALALGLLAFLARSRRGLPSECGECGAPHCLYCRRYGDPMGYCSRCAPSRKESKGIDLQLERAEKLRRLTRSKDRTCRLLSLLFPGTHRVFSQRPVSGFLVLSLFFFLLAAAGISGRVFGPRQLDPGAWKGLTVVTLAAAAAIWAASLWSAWRHSHGS